MTLNQGQPNVTLVNDKLVTEEEILVINNQIKIRDFQIIIGNIKVEEVTNLLSNSPNTLVNNQVNNQPNNLINNSNSTQLAQNQNQQYVHSSRNQNINQNNLNKPDINTLNIFNQAANQNQNGNYIVSNQQPSNTISGEIKLNQSLLQAASEDNFDAISTMFRQFIPDDEKIHFARYLGIQGIWGFGTRQFACITDRRVADITV